MKNRRKKKAPHEMTLEEFTRSLRVRYSQRYHPTIEEFAKRIGIDPTTMFPTDVDIARFVGGSIAERTKAGRGKLAGIREKFEVYKMVQAKYDAAKDRGEVYFVTDSESFRAKTTADLAYARAQHKRALVLAVERRDRIPKRVLKDYPDIRLSMKMKRAVRYD